MTLEFFYQYSDQKIRRPLNSSNIGDHGILILDFCWNSSRIRCLQNEIEVCHGRKNGDIEALADAMRALKNLQSSVSISGHKQCLKPVYQLPLTINIAYEGHFGG